MGARDGEVVDVEPHNVYTRLRRQAEIEASAEAKKMLKDNPVIQAIENDEFLNREMKSEGINGYAERLLERKPQLDEAKKAAKGNPVLEAIVNDPYLSVDEKFDFVRKYLRLKESDNEPEAIERRPSPPKPTPDRGSKIE